MIANACFNVFILFRYPQYEDAQRNNAESEIKDFLAANPAFSQRIFDGGVQAGSELFRSNPGKYYTFCDAKVDDTYIILFPYQRQISLVKDFRQCFLLPLNPQYRHSNKLLMQVAEIMLACKLTIFVGCGIFKEELETCI